MIRRILDRIIPGTLRGLWVVAVLCSTAVLGAQTWIQVTGGRDANMRGWLVAGVASGTILTVATLGHLHVRRLERRERLARRTREAVRQYGLDVDDNLPQGGGSDLH